MINKPSNRQFENSRGKIGNPPIAECVSLTEFELQVLDMETNNVAHFVRNHPEKDTFRVHEVLNYIMTSSMSDDGFEKKLDNYQAAVTNYLRPKPFYGETIFEINIPSGKIIANDSLFYQIPDIDFEGNFHEGIGRDEYSRQIADERGIIYLPVGNTCPEITIQPGEDIIRVVCPETDESFQNTFYLPNEQPVAGIVTDLWAVSMMDYDNWLSYGGKDFVQGYDLSNGAMYSIFDVTPGKYRVTIHSNSESFDRDTPRVEFATMELVLPVERTP